MAIVRKRLPGIEQHLLQQVVNCVQHLRKLKLNKTPGVSETIDWAQSLLALGYREVNAKAFDQTLGSILKNVDDMNFARTGELEALLKA